MKFLITLLSFFVAATVANQGAKLSRAERVRLNKEEAQKYMELRRQGVDEVSHTEEAAAMRNYQLRKKKRKGLLRKKDASLAQILFPGVSPVQHSDNEEVIMYTDLVNSKKTQGKSIDAIFNCHISFFSLLNFPVYFLNHGQFHSNTTTCPFALRQISRIPKSIRFVRIWVLACKVLKIRLLRSSCVSSKRLAVLPSARLTSEERN